MRLIRQVFAPLKIPKQLGTDSAILDGEIVVLDNTGSSQFNELLFHRVEPYFYAFDVLWCEGKDLRLDALHEHKRKLRSLLTMKDRLLFCDHLEDRGKELFTHVAGFRGRSCEAEEQTCQTTQDATG
jgi:ATP-dependent DNA ligase